MKIFHYLRSVKMEDGGVVRAVLDHCEMFASQNNNIVLASAYPLDVPDSWRISSSSSPFLVDIGKHLRWDMYLSAKGIKLIEEKIIESDIVYLHEIWRPENVQLAYIARKWNRPYLVPIYGNLTSWATKEKAFKKKLYHRLFGKKFLEGARFLQCVNKEEQSQAKRWAPNGKWAIMPYLIDTSEYLYCEIKETLQSTDKGESNLRFLFLSRFHPKKGLEILIEAAHIIKNKGFQFSVVVAGSGDSSYQESLYKRVADRDLCDSIKFIGVRFGLEKLRLYRSVDAVVLPTYSDNFGVVLIEAMGCGTPIITTRKVDIWREIQQAGAIVVGVDANELAGALEDFIMMSKGDRLLLGKKSREWVETHLGTTRLLSIYKKLHENALENPFNGQVVNFELGSSESLPD